MSECDVMYKVGKQGNEYTTMIEAMAKENIFDLSTSHAGGFEVFECCDWNYHCDLTKDQLLALAREIRHLALGVK